MSVLMSILSNSSRRVHVVLKTWKCSDWCCIQNEDGVEITLWNWKLFILFVMLKNFFVWATPSLRFAVVKYRKVSIYYEIATITNEKPVWQVRRIKNKSSWRREKWNKSQEQTEWKSIINITFIFITFLFLSFEWSCIVINVW